MDIKDSNNQNKLCKPTGMAKVFCKPDTEGFEAGDLSSFQYFYSKLLLARVTKWEKVQFVLTDGFSKWTKKVSSTD